MNDQELEKVLGQIYKTVVSLNSLWMNLTEMKEERLRLKIATIKTQVAPKPVQNLWINQPWKITKKQMDQLTEDDEDAPDWNAALKELRDAKHG